MGATPEGIVVDPQTNTMAVAVRDPFALVLLDATTGAALRKVPLPGAVRHLRRQVHGFAYVTAVHKGVNDARPKRFELSTF